LLSANKGGINCCPDHIEVVIGAAGLDIGIGMGSVPGMIIGTGMGEWQESLECGLV